MQQQKVRTLQPSEKGNLEEKKKKQSRRGYLTPIPVLICVLLLQERQWQAAVILHERSRLQVEILLEILHVKIKQG
jgi:hypothetical protein